MNRLVGITFTNEAVLGHGVGYLTFETGDIEHKQYELNYSAERPMCERFTLYIDDQCINLLNFLSKSDLERLNEAYFDFKTTKSKLTYATVQLQNCYELCVDLIAS